VANLRTAEPKHKHSYNVSDEDFTLNGVSFEEFPQADITFVDC